MEMQNLYDDRWLKTYSDGDELLKDIQDRDAATKCFTLANLDNVHIWHGKPQDDGSILMVRFDGTKLLNKTLKAQYVTPALAHTASYNGLNDCGTRLFLSYPAKARTEFVGISAAAKTSLVGRSGVSYYGEMDDYDLNIDPVALASMLETTIKANAKKVQIVTVYGKVIGVMSERFSFVPQGELVDTVYSVLLQRHKDAMVSGGIITNKIITVDFDLHESIIDCGNEHEIMLRQLNSHNGCSSVHYIPFCRRVINKGGKRSVSSIAYLFDDDGWACNHVGIDMARIIEGADTMLLKLRDNVALMSIAENYILKYPLVYAEKAIEQLNRLATNKGGTKVSKKLEKEILGLLETFISNGIQTQFTVMDIADNLISNIPQDAVPATKDSMMKTIMRIIHLKHADLDTI